MHITIYVDNEYTLMRIFLAVWVLNIIQQCTLL